MNDLKYLTEKSRDDIKKICDECDIMFDEYYLRDLEFKQEHSKEINEYLKHFRESVNWEWICSFNCFTAPSEDFFRLFHDELNWKELILCHNLSEKLIRDFMVVKDLSLDVIIEHQKVSLKFLQDFEDNIDIVRLSYNSYLTEDIVREYCEELNVEYLVNNAEAYKYLSSKFLKMLKVWR